MPEFTKEEISFISQVLTQLSWKAGQSNSIVMAENIIRKCNPDPKPAIVENK